MKCPIDGTHLVISDRSGVEIDYCSNCRGVWLDRGELDKIIERSSDRGGYGASGYDAGQHEKRPEKRKLGRKMGGFLEDIFDF